MFCLFSKCAYVVKIEAMLSNIDFHMIELVGIFLVIK